MRRLTVTGMSLAFLLAAASGAFAAPIQYSDRATFTAAAGSLTTETFNSFASDVNLAGGATVDLGPFTVKGPTSGVARIDAGGDGVTPVNGTAYIQGIGAGGSNITFTFDAPIFAFGVDLFGVNDGGVERTRVVIGGNTYNLPVVGGNVASFFGLISDVGFTTVAFTLLTGEDAGLDNVSFAATPAAVPEPASLSLLALGLAGVAAKRRLRR